jgi:hypothetical protein
MEPVFMLLGQSTAIAADMALGTKSAVQDINMPSLQQRLLEAGQVLKWEAKKPPAK